MRKEKAERKAALAEQNKMDAENDSAQANKKVR